MTSTEKERFLATLPDFLVAPYQWVFDNTHLFMLLVSILMMLTFAMLLVFDKQTNMINEMFYTFGWMVRVFYWFCLVAMIFASIFSFTKWYGII